MKDIVLKCRTLNLQDYTRRSAEEGDYSTLITEPTRVFDSDGNLLIVYAYIQEDLTSLWRACINIPYSKGTRTSGLKTLSRIFGWRPRTSIRNNWCSATSLATEAPEYHDAILRVGGIVARYYEQYNPDLYARHKAITEERVDDDYHIEQQAFTSGIVNKNNPLKYHFDSGNFKNVWSGMVVLKHRIDGGYLSVPELDCAFELKTNSLLLFDGQSLLHGVTPIRKLSSDALRFSIVYYSLQQMWNCEPLTAELARARQKRTEIEERRVSGTSA